MNFASLSRSLAVGVVLFLAVSRPAPVLAAAPVGPYGDSSYGLVVDTSKREQSRVFFQTAYQASQNVASGWTGNIAQGKAGATSSAFRDATALRVNYFRAMAGMPAAITFADTYNSQAQQAALMMCANRSLNHQPPTSWLSYTAEGAAAAGKSNLNFGGDGPKAIDDYFQEPGASNYAAGHRRWVLFPPTNVMGTGDVDGTGAGDAVNALWIMDTSTFSGAKPATREAFVAWPPAGFVPYQVVYPRWSFSVPGGDVSGATVTMQRAGQTVALRQETVLAGFGDSTLVWVPDGQATDFMTPTAPANGADVPYHLVVSNVQTGGGLQTFSYDVTVFDPAKPGEDTVPPTLHGPAQVNVGASGAYSFDAVPGATGYRWTTYPVTPLTTTLDAENGLGAATAFPAGTDLRASTAGATGASCYQLSSGLAGALTQEVIPNATGTSLTLDANITPASGSALKFNAKLGFNTPGERAAVQVSTDGAVTWQNVFSQAGTGQAESAFAAKSVDLSSYAGQTIRVRFVYSAAIGQQYIPRTTDAGWFLDDIKVSGARSLGAAQSQAVADGALGFNFSPAAGIYALQVTPLFFGGRYAADPSTLLFVDTATTDGGGGTLPEIKLAATVPTAAAGTGGAGVFTFTRTDNLTSEVTVLYSVSGNAKNGTDYTLLSGHKKLKSGKSSTKVRVSPLGAAAGGSVKRVVNVTLLPGTGYTVGADASVKIKLSW